MLMQRFWGQTRCIIGDVEMANVGAEGGEWEGMVEARGGGGGGGGGF